ncbi:putative phosphoglycerate mutase [Paenibacillus cellulosilyticus]|uniref:Putative phosphoglycerate mutase n=1 Tax=Paenibacillus cellulosilyticus TaxID=375489 RepID=A0A2V2YYT9_9BACL|nr:histidine phosphatase family protein [Paenibacillus cellulosilyticus]PWW04902.1 putative phosphoglycerate mutase [Paenibacillus cellulosilyticus]QKS46006.1 histidine phosphatase family protein [Paenibacillus cellulosilyticus]
MIYVVRHGQTDWNREGRLQGRSGLPLNDTGLMQAEHLRDTLKDVKFDYVFSSPQERAIQTAEIATGMRTVVDNRLDVFDLGEADGLARSEVKLVGAAPDSTIYPGVEDTRTFVARIFHFMKELEARYGPDNVNILIAGHRCTTGCMGAYFEGIPEDGNILRLSSDNGSYKQYQFNNEH